MTITILHLSDIQYGPYHVDKGNHSSIDSNSIYSSQLEKMKEDLKTLREQEGINPNFIVVSGDIAETSSQDEYKQASVFLTGLVEHLGIKRHHVILVPGNHDINRYLCQSARLEAKAYKKPFEPPYFRKFQFYEEFFDDFYKDVNFPDNIKRYLFSEEDLFVNFCFPEHGVVFVGLNSCINESEEKPHFGNITVKQLNNSISRLNDTDLQREMLRVAVMHHNFVRSSDNDDANLKDAGELEPILIKEEFSMLLHGHQHITGQKVVWAGNAIIHVLATGSAGLDREAIPGNIRRYQIIQIEEERVRVFKRLFDNNDFHLTGKGTWKPDIIPGNTSFYDEFTLKLKSNSLINVINLT